LLVGRTTIAALLEQARSRLQRLGPEQTLAAQHAGALLVDTRSQDERVRDGVIPGALHIRLSVLPWRMDPASEWRDPAACDLERHVILICTDGYASSLAAALLQALGFTRATDLAGGFKAWRAAGLPVAVV
jgi:rhodanese-related sulfurtransferase